MKSFLIVFMLFASGVTVFCQDLNKTGVPDLKELYYSVMLYPDIFGDYVQKNRKDLKRIYNDCLAIAFEKNIHTVIAETEYSNDKELRERAIGLSPDKYKDSPVATTVLLIATLYSVFEGDLQWSDSFYGQYLIFVKKQYADWGMEAYSGISYKSVVDLSWQFAAPFFSCK